MEITEKKVNPKLNLESIVDSEIFPPEKNIFKKAKQKIEKVIFHNKNKIIIPLSIATGSFAYYYSHLAIEKFWDILKILRPESSPQGLLSTKYAPMIGLAVGAGTYIAIDDAIKKRIGSMILGMKELKNNPKKKKDDFLSRHKTEFTLGAWFATMAVFVNGYYEKISSLGPTARQALSQNAEKIIPMAIAFGLGCYGVYSLFFSKIGRISLFKSNEMKRATSGAASYKLSKKNGIRYLESESRRGNVYADMILAELEKNIDKKLEYEKKVIERIRTEKLFFSEEINWVKPQNAGSNYTSSRKGNIESIISTAMGIYQINPERSIRLFNKLGEAAGENTKPHIVTTKIIFLNAHGADTTPDYKELRSILDRLGLLKFVEGSEGFYSQFLDNFTGKNIIFKDYKVDKSNKFFLERAILEILKGSRISVENPLSYYDEGDVHKQIFIRDGEKNLREFLEGKSEAKIGEYFEKLLPMLSLYQQKVFSALEEKGPEFIMSTEFRGTKRRLKIPVLNLETSLKRRAFYGSKPGELRLGDNEYLEALLNKLNEYNQLNQYATIDAFNRGDTTAANITETLCIIDPRPCIAHPLYDFAYISCDPVFTPLSFGFRKEMALEANLGKDEFKGMAADFSRAFDSLYTNLALSNAGANLSLGKKDLAKIIIKDLLKFSKGMPFDNELRMYLEHSNAS